MRCRARSTDSASVTEPVDVLELVAKLRAGTLGMAYQQADVVTAGEQSPRHRPADQAGRADDQDPHGKSSRGPKRRSMWLPITSAIS